LARTKRSFISEASWPQAVTLAEPRAAAKSAFFATSSEFRAWLEERYDKDKELWVGFHKTSSGKQSITWPEAVGEALCFGWID
jgi:uncharacterized protein YdeI (YjbR/CyaY-like superfamily)